MTSKALSIRSPWWWFILHAGKDIENRDWKTNFRGEIYIHASSWWAFAEVKSDTETALCCHAATEFHSEAAITWPEMRGCGGHIVGTVEISDCVQQSESPWFFGDYGFVLGNPKPLLRPIPCKGHLGFFELPVDVMDQIKAQS